MRIRKGIAEGGKILKKTPNIGQGCKGQEIDGQDLCKESMMIGEAGRLGYTGANTAENNRT